MPLTTVVYAQLLSFIIKLQIPALVLPLTYTIKQHLLAHAYLPSCTTLTKSHANACHHIISTNHIIQIHVHVILQESTARNYKNAYAQPLTITTIQQEIACTTVK